MPHLLFFRGFVVRLWFVQRVSGYCTGSALIVRSCLAGSEFHRDCLSVDTDLAYRGFVSFG